MLEARVLCERIARKSALKLSFDKHSPQATLPKKLYNLSMSITLITRGSKDGKLGEKGQVVIPAEFREVLGLKPGDAVMMILEEGAVRITTRAAIVKELSGAFATTDGRSLSAELLEERRAEAQRKW